jgi:hypothetical protein
MLLTIPEVRNVQPREKPYKLADGNGMYLEVMPNGGRYWRVKYRHQGKEKRIALGVFPEVGLKEARAKRDIARKLVAEGIDPSAARKDAKAGKLAAVASSFEAVAREWMGKFAPTWAESTLKKTDYIMARDVFPWIGARLVGEVSAPELLTVRRRIEGRGALETAHKVREYCGQVFRYAIATCRAERDPSADLRGALPTVKAKHHASVTDPKAVADLLRVMDGYQGAFVTRCALLLAPLVFVRPGELRHAEWSEIDVDAQEWRIPGEKMKMGALFSRLNASLMRQRAW